jgi:hypothetical protein
VLFIDAEKSLGSIRNASYLSRIYVYNCSIVSVSDMISIETRLYAFINLFIGLYIHFFKLFQLFKYVTWHITPRVSSQRC